jgi:hypothetical protein
MSRPAGFANARSKFQQFGFRGVGRGQQINPVTQDCAAFGFESAPEAHPGGGVVCWQGKDQ